MGATDKAMSLRARARARKLARDGTSPLDVMLGNMMFWHGHVEVLDKQLRELVVQIEDEDERRQALRLLAELLHARERSQECARDAAPFCHAKLANISIDDANDRKEVIITGGLPEESAELPAPGPVKTIAAECPSK